MPAADFLLDVINPDEDTLLHLGMRIAMWRTRMQKTHPRMVVSRLASISTNADRLAFIDRKDGGPAVGQTGDILRIWDIPLIPMVKATPHEVELFHLLAGLPPRWPGQDGGFF